MSFDTTLRPDPFIGRSFGAYRLTERIAEVRVGAAFVAEHRHLERRAVVKLFQPAPPGTPGGGLPRVAARLRALSRASHESILPLVDVGEGDGGLVFVVLELQDEEALATLAVRGQAALPWPTVRTLGCQIAGAMRWAAEQGVAPTDLAPAQIFVASQAGAEARARIDIVTLETLGLREPPPRGDAADVMAIGRALYLLLTGRSPGTGGADGSIVPPARQPGLEVPPDADALVMRALDPEPGEGWPDLGALHRALGGRDADVAAASPSRALGRAWFASAAPPAAAATAAAPAGAGESATHQTAAADDPHAAAVFDDRDFDRFGGPGADFSSDFGPDLDEDTDFDTGEGSFGAKSIFARPSRRALISAGVAGGAALALLVVVVGPRIRGTERESRPPSGPAVAQGPAPSETDAATAAGPRTDGSAMAAVPQPDGAATVAGPFSVSGGDAPGGPPVAPAEPAPSRPRVPAPAGEVPPARATSQLGSMPARPAAGPAPASGDAVAVPPGSSGRLPSVPPLPDLPVAAAPPGIGNGQAPGSTAGQLPVPGGPASPEALGPSPADVVRAPPHDVGDGLPGAAQPAGPAPAAAVPGTPGAEATSRAPLGRCAVSLGSKPWADVWIDGRRAGFSPMNDLPIACGTHEIAFTSRELGVERRISLTVRPGETVKRVVDLEASSPPPEAGTTEVPPAPFVGRVVKPECRLSLGSRPWAEVWLDGRRVGVTPLVSMPVRCGKHDVLFLSREANVQRHETIVVPEGQSVKKIVTLVEGE